jgi:hypothetical protein
MAKILRKFTSILILVLLLSIPSTTAFAESLKELGASFTQEELNRAYPDGDPRLNREIGPISAEEKQAGLEKSEMAQKVMAIREKAISNPKSITKSDVTTVQSYINKYFKGGALDTFIPNTSTLVTMSNPGDYQYKRFSLPGQVQLYDNYCGPASAYAVLKYKGINVTQDIMAQRLGIVPNGSGTSLGNFPGALNYYSGTNGNYFSYAVLWGPGSYSSSWAVTMTNDAISTLLGNYGVVYDVHMVNVSGSARLQGYETMQSPEIRHYVAGEGFDSTDPSARICFYYDSNNLKSNLGTRHMWVTFGTMAHLTDDMGLVF